MDAIEQSFKSAARAYNRGSTHHSICYDLTKLCLTKLHNETSIELFGPFHGSPSLPYYVARRGNAVSRPFRRDIFDAEIETFDECYTAFQAKLRESDLNSEDDIVLANKVIYTAVLSFAACYDLWKPASRKTPGTFFEILMAGLFGMFMPQATLSKHVSLRKLLGEDREGGGETGSESVATDLVVTMPGAFKSAIIPLKITTRERIVQPYAHQRILDSACPGEYTSLLACISETQLDHKTKTVKQVCVPGTVKLFQRHLAALHGIYYCDIPQRYAAADLVPYIPVKRLGEIFHDTMKVISGV